MKNSTNPPQTKNKLSFRQAYFDCNATTPVLPVAADAAVKAMQILYGNPSSLHLVGLQAKNILENTRNLAAQAIGAAPSQMIFTSGATEAIQTAVFSALVSLKNRIRENKLGKTISEKNPLEKKNLESEVRQKKILYSATEHKAVPQAIYHWAKILELPVEILEIPVDSKGQVQLGFLRDHLPDTALLCTMAVNNETGVIQNLAAIEILLIETQSQALWLVDCVQALGKVNLDLSSKRIHYATFSGHKLYAPKGIGFLYVKPEAPLTPLIVGGGQEKGLRSGTENLPGVAALGAVLEMILNGSFLPHSKMVEFRERIAHELKCSFPKIQFNHPFEISVPTTLNFSIPGFTSNELLDLFDSGGLRLSAGSACSSGSTQPSHVLRAMGWDDPRSSSALRLSFGPATSEEEISRGCQIIRQSALALKNTCLLESPGGFDAPDTLRDGIIQFRAGANNTWMVVHRENRACVIIDPCETLAERLERYIRCQNLRVLAILDTHSHADHESARPMLMKILSNQIQPQNHSQNHSQVEWDHLGWPSTETPLIRIIRKVSLENGAQVPALLIQSGTSGNLVLARLETPGHTQDSVTFLLGLERSGTMLKKEITFAFSGDTLLSGGLGRTNFVASDTTALYHTLQRLHSVLHPSTLICPAHDYNQSFATSLKVESHSNPLLNLALQPSSPLNPPMNLQLFLERKAQIDQELVRLEENFDGVICGVTRNPSAADEDDLRDISISKEKIEERLNSLQSFGAVPLQMIDVREPQEYALFQDWSSLGFSAPPRNVPLSRFVNFMGELMTQQKTSELEPGTVLICRSGNRSLQAAKVLRKLGFRRTWSLAGGIALASQK